MALSAGARVGPYEILSALGAGGMGQVYRATDTTLKRQVAVKILPPSLAADPERLARFQREAEVLAALNHPHIAAVYGLEEAGGVKALVMELVEGDDLSQRIARGPISLDEALPIARQIAEALEAAHEQGIIHRDLKPANIKVRPDGTVKVLDFGLAKLTQGEAAARAGRDDLSQSPTLTSPAAMTGTGMVLGTAAYMSPEQARGRAVDKRTDIWAFGAVLYEMLSGARAFDGEDTTEMIASVMKTTPNWSALPADVPVHIVTLIQRCLEKDRKKRIADISIALFLIDEPVIGSPATSAIPAPVTLPRPIWRRAISFVVTALLAGALVGGVAWNLRPPAAPSTITRFPMMIAEGQRFTGTGRPVIAISPDGTQIVYVADQGLYIRSMSDLKAMPIPGTETPQGVLNPVFSPDGRFIAFWSVSDGTVKRIGIAGGTAATICPAIRPFGMTWDADGILLGQGRAGIVRVPATGGKPEILVKVSDGEVAYGPQMLPDGRDVLFTLATGTDADRWDKAKIVVQSLKSGERKTLIEGGSDGRYLPTGHIVYAVGRTLFAVPFDLRRLEAIGGRVPIVEGVLRVNLADVQTGVAHFSVSNTGSLIYIPGPVSATADQRDLVRLDRHGSVEPLKLRPGPYEFPRVSPDGTRLAVGTDDGKEAIVWIYDLAGASSMRRLTFGGRNRFPIWSADGESVAFQSDREGDLGIFWQRADGTGMAERLTRPEQGTSHFPEAWEPKGERFLFSASQGVGVSLWAFSLRERTAERFGGVQQSSPGLTRAVFSPDGRWVAYTADEPPAVYVQPFPATGAKHQIAKNTAHSPLWSPNGKEIFFVRHGNLGPGVGQIVVTSVATEPSFTLGNPVVVTSGSLYLAGGLHAQRGFDMAPDGAIIGVVDSVQTAFTGALANARIEVVLNWFEDLKARVPSK
jgi:serine/threonine-protein kinase